jgi:hypothetical protein
MTASFNRAPSPSAILSCRRCFANLQPGNGSFYDVCIQAVADPTPADISAEDLVADVRKQIERVLAQFEGTSEEDAMAQVYRRLTFRLCAACFRWWIENPLG